MSILVNLVFNISNLNQMEVMKLVTIVKPFKLDDVREALSEMVFKALLSQK